MKNKFLILIALIISWISIGGTGWYIGKNIDWSKQNNFLSPLVVKEKKLPLLAFTIPNLTTRDFLASEIKVERILNEQPEYTTFLFSYTTYDHKMTGAMNVPTSLINQSTPVNNPATIIMLRGYVPLEIYQPGVGTKNAAAVLAKNGYVTLAPDFFGYGESEAEPADTWEARFIKPINVVELIKSLETYGVATSLAPNSPVIKTNNFGIWAHSNGGQIALTTLEILQQPIPASLWAPVTAPFPYSVMFFSDEVEDEGKDMRKYVSLFEQDYDAFDFSLTKHLNLLTGPIQIQQGEADEAIPSVWNDEFIDRLKAENKLRQQKLATTDSATPAATLSKLQPITINYFTYAGADHNMKGSWDNAIQKDLEFFKKYLPQ
jgi:dienelactone hydrolase